MSLLGRLSRAVLAVQQLPAIFSACQLQTWLPAGRGGPGPLAPAARRLLAAATPQVLPSCGMKMRYNLRRRCKHCYLVARHNRWYIMCPVHPRHKQMSLVPHPKTQWILSDVMQTPRRPW
ncbi:39S ribosomal protein L36, mitochondrial-like [Pollicipes pollicipes]|uniref:39S ribosomal protein L36, mitochondrial-like n=1 Tax=Pollicipes pollicipes TaxID=41117 RepID=UPI0018849DAC|nr:39S ribosomal protein L36, mitochondrial-like [Pollicipes pollicipes]